MARKRYLTKYVYQYGYNKETNDVEITGMMYSVKPSRKKAINELSDVALKRQVEKNINKTNKKLNNLWRDTNRGTFNPKTKRFERKSSYTIIDEKGNRKTIKKTNIVDYRGKFASKKLLDLENYNQKQNKVILKGNESREELLKINKTLKNFNKSKTSTLTGINEVEKGIKETIGVKLDDFEITPEETETLYNFFEDKDIQTLRNYIDISDIWVILESTKTFYNNLGDDLLDDEKNILTFEHFMKLIGQYVDSDSIGVDKNLQDSLKNIYNKINVLL